MNRSAPVPRHRPRIAALSLAPLLSACVLIAAIAGKSATTYSDSAPMASWWESRAITGALIASEGVLLAWICWGGTEHWLRRYALALFSTFFVVATWFTLTDAPSCGCFGRIVVPPWITLMIDALLIVLWWRHHPGASRPGRTRAVAGMLVAAITALIGIAGPSGWVPSAGGGAGAAPLRPVLPPVLRTGRWLVVVYRNDCADCKSSFQRWGEALGRAGELGHASAFVNIGPVSSTDLCHGADLPEEVACLHWPELVVDSTPVALAIADGRIEQVFRKPWLVSVAQSTDDGN